MTTNDFFERVMKSIEAELAQDNNTGNNNTEINADRVQDLFDLFDKYAHELYAPDEDGGIDVHWGYNESLEYTDILEKIFKRPKKDLSLIEQIEQVFYEENLTMDIEASPYYVLSELLQDPDITDEDKDFIRMCEDHFCDYFYDTYYTNLNIAKLLNNTPVKDLTLIFDKEEYGWDDSYLTEVSWENILELVNQRDELHELGEEVDEDFEDELEVEISYLETESTIGWLVKQQGYEIMDVFDEEKLDQSKFLKQLHKELFHYDNLKGMQLAALPWQYNATWEDLYAVCIQRKPAILEAGTCFGLIDTVHGSAGAFGIYLEKDIQLEDAPLHAVHTKLTPAVMYGVRDIYGDDLEDYRDGKMLLQ